MLSLHFVTVLFSFSPCMSPWQQSLTDFLDLYDVYAEEWYDHLEEDAFLLKEYTPLLADAIWAFALALHRSEGSQKQRKVCSFIRYMYYHRCSSYECTITEKLLQEDPFGRHLLSDFTYDSDAMSRVIYHSALEVDFRGLTVSAYL